MVDPSQAYVDVTVELSPDVTLFPGTILQGRPSIGAGAEIGPSTRLVDTQRGCGRRRRQHGRSKRRRSGPTASSVRSRCSTPAPSLLPGPGRAPSTLLLGATNPDSGDVGGRRIDGARHQEAVRPLLRAGPPRARRGDRGAPRRRARRSERPGLLQRRDAAALRRVGAWLRRLHHADARRHVGDVDQRRDHGAADHDRRGARVRRPSASPRSARSTATPGRTARPRAASRSPRSWSPTCSRPPARSA